jgi:hypothetical protein
MLKAEVTVGSPFEGDRAVLPLRVDEGRVHIDNIGSTVLLRPELRSGQRPMWARAV